MKKGLDRFSGWRSVGIAYILTCENRENNIPTLARLGRETVREPYTSTCRDVGPEVGVSIFGGLIMPTSTIHHQLSEIDEQVFLLHESVRKLELIEESLCHADPNDSQYWTSILHIVMGAERQHMRQAFESLNRLSSFQEEMV